MIRYAIREAQLKDTADLLELTRYFPLCNLPSKALAIEKKIHISQKSFDKTLDPFKRNYLFVLEDRQKKQVIGSSQILSYFGDERSLCYFLNPKTASLQIQLIKEGQHQLGGLILSPKYRKSKALLGLQIGIARFLYIKQFPKDFSKKLEVSLTPPLRNQSSDFWKETGELLIKKNYSLARLAFQKDRKKFFQAFPKKLILPLKSLSPLAKAGLNKVHPQTLPIYKGLLKRGFYKTQTYDLLDGGLYLEAYWAKLPFLKIGSKFKTQL